MVVKGRHDFLKLGGFHRRSVIGVFVIIGSSEINILENLFLLLLSENLLDNTDWGVVFWSPRLELRLEFITDSVVNESLSSKSAEFVQPSFGNNFSVHGGFKSIFS